MPIGTTRDGLRRRPLAVLGALLAVVVVLVGGGADPAGASGTAMAQFRQLLIGHDRTIHVSAHGYVTETYYNGCCPPVSRYTMKLTDVHFDKKHHARGRLKVISIHIDPKGYRFPGVHVGTTGTTHVINGVYLDSIFKTTFCNGHAEGTGVCGA